MSPRGRERKAKEKARSSVDRASELERIQRMVQQHFAETVCMFPWLRKWGQTQTPLTTICSFPDRSELTVTDRYKWPKLGCGKTMGSGEGGQLPPAPFIAVASIRNLSVCQQPISTTPKHRTATATTLDIKRFRVGHLDLFYSWSHPDESTYISWRLVQRFRAELEGRPLPTWQTIGRSARTLDRGPFHGSRPGLRPCPLRHPSTLRWQEIQLWDEKRIRGWQA